MGDCQCLWTMVRTDQRDLYEGEKSKSHMGMDKKMLSLQFICNKICEDNIVMSLQHVLN